MGNGHWGKPCTASFHRDEGDTGDKSRLWAVNIREEGLGKREDRGEEGLCLKPAKDAKENLTSVFI